MDGTYRALLARGPVGVRALARHSTAVRPGQAVSSRLAAVLAAVVRGMASMPGRTLRLPLRMLTRPHRRERLSVRTLPGDGRCRRTTTISRPPPTRRLPTSADFDQAFAAIAASPGVRQVWELAEPELPPQIEPFSFVSVGLLRYVAQALDLSPGQTFVDLGCGRGGPGLWLAQQASVSLVGVDFSPVAVDQAAHRAELFGLADRARFVVGDLTGTGLPWASADAVVSIDAFHFAADPAVAAVEARRSCARPTAGADQLAAEEPRGCPVARQDAYRLAARTSQGGLR